VDKHNFGLKRGLVVMLILIINIYILLFVDSCGLIYGIVGSCQYNGPNNNILIFIYILLHIDCIVITLIIIITSLPLYIERCGLTNRPINDLITSLKTIVCSSLQLLNFVTDHIESYNYIVLQAVLLTCHVFWMISLFFLLGIVFVKSLDEHFVYIVQELNLIRVTF